MREVKPPNGGRDPLFSRLQYSEQSSTERQLIVVSDEDDRVVFRPLRHLPTSTNLR